MLPILAVAFCSVNNLFGKEHRMGLIRKLAVRGYSKELNTITDSLSKVGTEEVATILIYAVWLRATLQVERNLPTGENENGNLNPELHSYPIMLSETEKWVSFLNKKGQYTKSFALSIWVHTLRSIIRPELSNVARGMWSILINSKPNWERLLTRIRDEDMQLGISHDVVLKTENYAKAILQCLPPKQLS